MLIISLIFLSISITVHEFAHAYSAYLLGDPTAKIYGRMSLNPLKHFDPYGLVALIVFKIGWGKPVPIDPYNFKNPKKDEIIVSAAGPLSNLLLALLATLSIKYIPMSNQVYPYITSFLTFNITLAVFNLIPIWPLDGSKILLNLLPIEKSIDLQDSMEKYGYILILFLAYTNILDKIINFFSYPLINLIYNFLS